MSSSYKLCLTGTIGAGKSTLLRALSEKYNGILHFETWVNDALGSTLLSKKIAGNISVATFQNYILDCWENEVKLSADSNRFHFFERNPDDTVATFCSFALKEGTISESTYTSLHERAREIQTTYKIPGYEGDVNFVKILSTTFEKNFDEIDSIIQSDIRNGITERIIGLSLPRNLSVSRVLTRGRTSECNYSKEFLENFNDFYEDLFKRLQK
jgi:deoxyadenosine/deoxycytidine kinase